MRWFVVSIISVIEITEGCQEDYPVFEDFFLFSADSEEELQAKIQSEIEIGNQAGASGVTYDDRPATQRYLGVRKIRAVYNKEDSDNCTPPTDGSELTHCFMNVSSLEDAERLAKGHAVIVTYIDDDPMMS
jgi:hypothetical protein